MAWADGVQIADIMSLCFHDEAIMLLLSVYVKVTCVSNGQGQENIVLLEVGRSLLFYKHLYRHFVHSKLYIV